MPAREKAMMLPPSVSGILHGVNRRPQTRHGGFALIITLSLMILLVVVGVGLLTLSTISLRSSSQGQAMAIARANARLAVMMALGDLQKNAGPDKRVTARADVLGDSIANPRLTGVWKSREIIPNKLPTPDEYSKDYRDKQFLGWLSSSSTGVEADKIDFAKATVPNPVTLWDKGSLGTKAPVADLVKATKLQLKSSRGSLAWAVMDEGVKVRINTAYLNEAKDAGQKTAQLGSGKTPDVGLIDDLDGLKRGFFDRKAPEYVNISKGISRLNFGLSANAMSSGSGEHLLALAHDITLNSAGLLTDVASGGFREDFQMLAGPGKLPSEYAGSGVYASRLGMKASDAISDPRWESLVDYASLYRKDVVSSDGSPLLKSRVPAGWVASSGSSPASAVTGTLQRNPPPGVVLMPTIAKVQIVFSLLARDIYRYAGKAGDVIPENSAQLHGPWGDNFRNSSYDYLLHLSYTPVITLHNPYNVAIEFTDMKISFSSVPFSIQVFRNGQAQTNGLVPLDQMYANAEDGKIAKRFGMNLKAKTFTGAPGAGVLKLLPGEVKIFSPYIPPSRSWGEENSSTHLFSDWDNKPTLTMNMDSVSGWPGDGIGFDLDWFCPGPMRVTSFEEEGGRKMERGGCIGMRRQDDFHVLFAPLSVPSLSNNKFVVEMFATPSGSSAQVSTGAIEMDYESPTGLQDLLIGKNGTYRYPKDGTLNTMDMLDHQSTQIRKYAKVRPFALLSARGKNTSGGRDADSDDGRLATKPWSFAHAAIGASYQKVVSEHPANQSHEIALELLEKGTANVLQLGNQDRGNFISGNTSDYGVKFGAMYDVPLGPVTSLASLNGANPGGSSGYLPRFAQPIGNSWAHPLMNTDRCIQPGTGANYLDHSFLLNMALYDHFYFSGLGDQTGSFGSNRTTSELAADYVGGKPLDDQRLILNPPDQRAAEELPDELDTKDASKLVGAWQMMKGAFNINSTSVPAWKAMLGSIRDSQALFTALNKTKGTSALNDLKPVNTGESRISRFRLPVSNSEEYGGDPKDGYWMGPREYSETELQTLAEQIVKQVRTRGPFLSLSEFVNRQLGPANEETSQRGALQQAIDDSKLNEELAEGMSGASAGYQILESSVGDYKYANPEAGAGASYQGAPGYLSQSDILSVLGNAATARSDTFTIRGYGEAKDNSNNVIATAICEVIVQRQPDHIDPADAATVAPANLTSPANITFGRRFQVASFRWLGQSEI